MGKTGTFVNFSVVNYNTWEMKNTRDYVVHLSVQIFLMSHQRLHKYNTNEFSVDIVKCWNYHVDKTDNIKAATLCKRKVVVAGGVMARTMEIILPKRQGSESIIDNLCKELSGCKGCPSKELVDKTKVTPRKLSPKR